MTSEVTVPEAASNAAWEAYKNTGLMSAALAAALPHLSTAICDAASGEETRFLIERLDELEQTILSGEPAEEIYREFNGHVAPSIARLRSALKSTSAPAEGNVAEAPAPAQAPGELVERLTRPIIGIENRSAQEAFNIMADRIRHAIAAAPVHQEAGE